MVDYITRTQLGLPPRVGGSRRELGAIDTAVVHYTTGEELGREDQRAWWRSIFTFHTRDRGWADIGYNYGIPTHGRDLGRVYVGRGLLNVGAHAPTWNTRSVGIAFLGDDDPGQDMPEEARRACAGVIADVNARRRGLGRRSPVAILGHRDTQPPGYTACPGDELAAWLASGLLLGKAPGSAPDRSQPPEEGIDVADLPLIRCGRSPAETGAAVKRAQGLLLADGRGPAGLVDRVGRPDGIAGPGTERACRRFQSAHSLAVDGVIGPRTWRKLLGLRST